MKVAAIYARVSSDQQKEENTIASQTAALVGFARDEGYSVPDEWVFEDQGYSGASLIRPGLERVRDLAAEGQIQAVLVYSPDRLSRKYAYQVLLTEEFAREGVEVRFVNAPRTATAEDQLMLQFQGMIAEYERAQILERSRRGKLHRARQGQISVLGGAPYGYLYVKKNDQVAAYYEIIEAEAEVVRLVYESYTARNLSIGAITNLLNDRQIPTRKKTSRWERSTIWAMLRNPAYKGSACFGKTATAPRQRITRPLRQRGGVAARDSANHEQPRGDWIEIPVAAIVSETVFALAEERLQANKARSPRRTIEPSVAQSMVSCSKCGYALYRTSTRSTAQQIYYYRCLGSDGWRRLGGPVCDNRPIRQDLLDTIVWEEIVKLIENPSLIQAELDRRLEVARHADPTKLRVDTLQRDLIRTQKALDRLVTAYQEELISLDELRRRSPALRQREQAAHAELQSIADQVADRAAYLRLAESLTAFLGRLRSSAETIDVLERQKIVRLLVKDILVGNDSIVIRHSIPIAADPSGGGNPPPADRPNGSQGESYLLRSGRERSALRRPSGPLDDPIPIDNASVQEGPDQANDAGIRDFLAQTIDQDVVVHPVEELLQVHIDYDPPFGLYERLGRQDGIVCAPARAEAVAVGAEGRIKDRLQDLQKRLLDQAVLHRGDAKLTLAAPRLRDHHATHRLWPVRPIQQAFTDGGPLGAQHVGRLVNVQSIHACCALVGAHLLQGSLKVLSRQNCSQQSRPCVVPGPRRARGFVKTRARTGFTRLLLLPSGRTRHLTHGLAHPWGNFTLSRSVLRSRSPASYYDLG